MRKCTRDSFVDTSTALLIGSAEEQSTKYSLYRTSNYKYKYLISTGETSAESLVADISFESAKKWASEHLSAEEYKKEFTVSNMDGSSSKVNLSVNGDGFTAIERIRGNTGKAISEILVDMIDYYEQTHGSLNE